MRKRSLAILMAVVVCMPGFAAALSMDAFEAHLGMLTIGNYTTDNALSAPIILAGASAVIALDALPAPWVLGLGIDLYGTWYEWNDVDGRADLSEPESGDSFFTVGLLASPRFGLRFMLSDAVAMGAFFGLDLLVRFPLAPFSAYTTLAEDRLPALGYFLAGRFLYPGIGWWMTWQATKDVGLALSLRGLAPLYRAWSPEVTAFLHQFVFLGTLGMTIALEKTATEPAAP